MKNDPLETMNAVSAKATVAGASLTGWGYIMSNEFAGFLGVVIAVIGLLLNTYFGAKRDRRAALEHASKLARAMDCKMKNNRFPLPLKFN